MDQTGMVICKLIEYDSPDIKRIQHALKVFGYAKAIAVGENLTEKELHILEAAALLHDIGIHESVRIYGVNNGKYQEELGPDIAKEMLTSIGYEKDEIDQICFMIGNHHSYKVDGGIVLQILFEADFIVNVDEGNLPEVATKTGKSKVFKTKTGTEMIDQIFGW